MTEGKFIIVEALFPGLTQLDFTGPHTVFSRLPNADVIVASKAGGTIESDGGLAFAATKRLADIAHCDLLFVPGGLAATEAALDRDFMREFRRLAEGARYVTSVCTGSLILGAAGLLTGKHAACHWAWRHMLPLFGAIPDMGRVVRDGNIITGGGVTAGYRFRLYDRGRDRGRENGAGDSARYRIRAGPAVQCGPAGTGAARRAGARQRPQRT